MSLQLEYMKDALDDVQGVQSEDEDVQDAYGALCHQIPILVLTNGLALTAAFVDAKSGDSPARAQAFKLTQRHMIRALGGGNAPSLAAVLNRTTRPDGQYMQDTFTILDAWVYYKRFAVSILDVEPGARDDVLDETAAAATAAAAPGRPRQET